MATPDNTRLPYIFVSVSNQDAQSMNVEQTYRSLFLGNKISSGAAEFETTYLVSDLSSAASLFGIGSSNYAFAESYFNQGSGVALSMIAVDDSNAAFVAASLNITFSGTLADGTLNLYIGGKNVQIPVAAADDIPAVVTRIIAAVQANQNLEVQAASVTSQPTQIVFTAKSKGTLGNSIKIEINAAGETDATGVTIPANSVLASGANHADSIESAIDSISEDVQYTIWSSAFTDATSITAFKTELESRFTSNSTTDAVFLSAILGTPSEINTLGLVPNSQHISYIATPPGVLNTYWSVSGAFVSRVAHSAAADPALPFTGLQLNGLTYVSGNEISFSARNQFLFNGVSSYSIRSNTVRLARVITTYRQNENSIDDVSYLDLNTLLTLSYFKFDTRVALSVYLNQKLADDGVRTLGVQNVVTPSVIRAAIVSRATNWESDGLLEDIENFTDTLEVERDTNNSGRVNIVLRPNLVNQFRVADAEVRFVV